MQKSTGPSKEPRRQAQASLTPPEAKDASLEAAELFIEALLSGGWTASTPPDEIAELCPSVWKRAIEVFGGNEAAARNWMDSPSPLLGGETPLLAAVRVRGTRRVLRVLEELADRSGFK